MHEPLSISAERLQGCLQTQYDLAPATCEFLPLGLDSNAGVYRVVSEQGKVYLLKVKAGMLYKPGCLVSRYLHEQGITSVVAPIPTRSSSLWTQLDEWTLLVYPFIEGDTSWSGMTDEQWKETGATFRRIHEIRLPAAGFEALRRETFDPAEYVQGIHTIETRDARADAGASEQALRAAWTEHQVTIHAAVATLETLGKMLRKRALPYVICHADLHPANLLRDPFGRVFVIDWDEVMLAPRERDFLFVRVTPTDSESLPGTSAFFEGYGQTAIDWTALTYYRYERAVQDLIAFAQEVLFRDDLGEKTRASSLEFFYSILAQGGEIEAASQAAANLPPDLIASYEE